MGVYNGEKPEYFKEALESIFNQTLPPDEVVIACDGPMTDELNKVIEWAQELHPAWMKIMRVEKNKGVGHSMMLGLPECRNDLIMRADSDDINVPHRAETQIRVMEEGGYDIISSTVAIFYDTPDKVEGERKLPTSHEEILKFTKYRCPFNQPSAMFRKSKAMLVGGYHPYRYGEDYNLWARMLIDGAKGHNIEEALVYMRMDPNSYGRRRSKDFYLSRKETGKYMYEHKFISLFQYWKFLFLYWSIYACPAWLEKFIYQKVLHRKEKEPENGVKKDSVPTKPLEEPTSTKPVEEPKPDEKEPTVESPKGEAQDVEMNEPAEPKATEGLVDQEPKAETTDTVESADTVEKIDDVETSDKTEDIVSVDDVTPNEEKEASEE